MKEELFREESDEKIEAMERDIQDLKNHPLMEQIKKEKAESILKKRQEAAEKIKQVEKERDRIIPKVRIELIAKEVKVKAAEALKNEAIQEYQRLNQEINAKTFQFEGIIKEQENFLITSADTAIGEAIQYFNEKLIWLRKPGRISHGNVGAEKNLISWKKTTREESNYEAVLSALRYCQDSIKELENMKLVPVLDVEKIEKMKKAVPSIDVYTEYTGEKSMPK